MADLSVEVVRHYGPSQLMAQPQNLSRTVPAENYKLAQTVAAARRLDVLLSSENVRVSSNTVSRILGNTGQVAFVVSADAPSVTNYTARVRVYGLSTVVATQNLGVPAYDGNNVIIVDMSSTFAGLS